MDAISYALIAVLSLVVAYLLGIFTGAHYVPTDEKRVRRMLELAEVGPGDRVVDLGSGDGRLLIEAARRGAVAVGYELNPVMVRIARRNVRKAGLQCRVTIRWADFWRENLSSFTVVTVYGIPYIMGRLERKLARELPKGARVVSNAFPLPRWPGSEHDRVFLYRAETRDTVSA